MIYAAKAYLLNFELLEPLFGGLLPNTNEAKTNVSIKRLFTVAMVVRTSLTGHYFQIGFQIELKANKEMLRSE